MNNLWGRFFYSFSFLILFASSGSLFAAGAGTPDSNFISNIGTGFSFGVYNVASQSDGKIVVGGGFTSFNGTTNVNRIARLNADGTLDTAFTTATGTGSNSSVYALATQSNGQIVVGGGFSQFNGTTVGRIARLNADGTLDAAFTTATGSGFNGIIYSFSIQSNGQIVVGGSFTQFNGTTVGNIARLNADGTLDAAFTTATGSGFNGIIYSFSIQSNGQIVVGGSFIQFNGTPNVNRIARLNADGTLDTAFTTATTGSSFQVRTLATQSNGQIVVGGEFTQFNGTTVGYIARLNADGTLDTAFTAATGTGSNNPVYALATQSNGQIVVGGGFTQFNGTTVGNIARLNADGTLDTAFTTNTGTGLDNLVYPNAMTLQSGTSNIIVGGFFTQTNGVSSNRISSFLNAAISPSTQAINGTVGMAITPTTAYTASGFTGTVSYSVNPTLPSGLNISSSTGVISGTPAAAQSVATYTVTGTDGTSSATATVDITVVAPPYSISPPTQTVSGTVGTAITPTTAFTDSGFSGAVTYTVSPSLPANLSLNSSTGVITGTPTTAQSSSAYTVTATGSTSGSATATVNIALAQGSQTITFGTAPTPTYSPAGTFFVSATATSGLTVAFTSQTTGICTVSGSTVMIVTAGTCVIAGNQAGDANWTAASQQTQTITISQASQAAFTATATPNTINVGGISTISASGGSGTGTIAYTLVSGSPCNLVAQTLTGTGSGICTVTATNPGDTNYLQSTSNVTVNVNLAPQTTLVVIPSSSNINVNGTSTLSTTGGNGTGPVTYAVTSGPCSVSGPTLTGTGAGTCSVTATKAADSTYASATSSPVTVTVSGPPPVINLVATPGPGLIRLDFTSNSQTPAAATARFQTMTGVIYTGTCVSTNGGVTASATGNSSPLTVTQVTAGKNYTCSVTGTDGSGSSTSAPSNAVIPQPAPQPPKPIPTLSEWAQILMMLMMVITAGWYGRRQLR
jgi:uncharacterized delta-60 repeat protein